MEKYYLGVDPGEKGAMTLIGKDVFQRWFFSDHTLPELSDILLDIKSSKPAIHAVLEDVKSIHGAGAMSTFRFGESKGKLIGLLCASRIPYTLVPPQTWQRAIFTSSDMVYESATIGKDGKPKKKVSTKKTSANAATRIFPDADFKRTSRCTRIDDNATDSALMAEYARRMNL